MEEEGMHETEATTKETRRGEEKTEDLAEIYFTPLLEESLEPVDSGVAEKALEEVTALLGRILRILISDGRVVQGEFLCMDKDLNFILGSATEYFGLYNDLTIDVIPEDRISHKLGMVVIPGNHVVKVMLLEADNTDLPKEEV